MENIQQEIGAPLHIKKLSDLPEMPVDPDKARFAFVSDLEYGESVFLWAPVAQEWVSFTGPRLQKHDLIAAIETCLKRIKTARDNPTLDVWGVLNATQIDLENALNL